MLEHFSNQFFTTLLTVGRQGEFRLVLDEVEQFDVAEERHRGDIGEGLFAIWRNGEVSLPFFNWFYDRSKLKNENANKKKFYIVIWELIPQCVIYTRI